MQRPQQARQRSDLIGLIRLTPGHPQPCRRGEADRFGEQAALADARRPLHDHHTAGACPGVRYSLCQHRQLVVAAADPAAAAAGARVLAAFCHEREGSRTPDNGQEQPSRQHSPHSDPSRLPTSHEPSSPADPRPVIHRTPGALVRREGRKESGEHAVCGPVWFGHSKRKTTPRAGDQQMIRYGNRDTIGRMGAELGQMCLAVAARGRAGPGRGGRWLPARPAVGLGAGPVLLWPAIRERTT